MNYLDSLNSKEFPVVGALAIYNVSTTTEMSFRKFKDTKRNTKAPVAIMKLPSMADVFRRACLDIQEKAWSIPGGSLKYKITIDDLGYDIDYIRRDITATWKSGNVGVATIGRVIFNKNNKEIEFITNNISGAFDNKIMEMEQQLRQYMKMNAKTIHSMLIRESIRRAFEQRLAAVTVKSGGGVYFVPKVMYNGLEALQLFVSEIPGANLHIFPVVGDGQRLATVVESLNDYVDTSLTVLQEKIDKSDGSAKKINEVSKMMRRIELMILLYSSTLDQEIDCGILHPFQLQIEELVHGK